MTKHTFGWRPSAVAVAACLCVMASAVHAQQTSGSINGRAAKGDTVQVENRSINVTRQTQVGDDGAWVFPQLPPGEYVVTLTRANGAKEQTLIQVAAGEGTTASFGGTQTVVVTGLAIRSIDVKSVESATTFTKEELDRVPVAQNVTAVTLLAPGAIQGDSRMGQTGSRAGNVPSLGGASPAENAYYINGFNVTNIVNGLAFNTVPYGAIAGQQVKTGGYGAEFGRSLGGVVSVTTKRGTNEWHGGANVSWEPKSLEGSSVYTEKAASGEWELFDRPGGTDKKSANLWLGGPIIPDKLFVFGLVQASRQETDTFAATRQTELRNSSPSYLLKFDWSLNERNLIEFTTFSDKSTDKVNEWNSPVPYGAERGSVRGPGEIKTGGQNNILKWTGWLTDDFSLSAMYGVGKYSRVQTPNNCPIVTDVRSSPTLELGCWTLDGQSTVSDAGDTRKAFRLDAEWVLGKHTLRAGLDDETYTSVSGEAYGGTGHNWYRIQTRGGRTQIRFREFQNGGFILPGMELETKNSAWYVEDNYQITSNLLASVGVRNESFTNYNPNKDPFIDVKDTWAPRIGMSWDVTGNADLKVYSNWGRYYIPVYANTNVRLSSPELFTQQYHEWDGTFDANGTPILGATSSGLSVFSDGTLPNAKSVVDPNIKPMFQDEFILGFQKALGDRWSVGVKYTHRKLKSGMDDICDDESSFNWAVANGYTEDEANAIAGAVGHCFLYNPGKDLTALVDLDGSGTLTQVKIPATALNQPQAKRIYDALEFTVERAWDKKWSLQASYVLAFSKGNTEGYVKSDIGQDDAGISQDFDYPGLMEGAEGYLPNDRRHTFKVFGSYALTPEWQIGANFILQSGRPKNCFGYYAGTLDSVSVAYGAASFYCNSTLNPRGSLGRTPWTNELGLQFKYTPMRLKGSSLTVDILNVFDRRGVRGIDEQGESAANTPYPRYGAPLLGSLQRPRTVRLTAQYEF